MSTDLMKKRPDKSIYYLKIAESVAMRSTCLRRKYGAVIVNRDEVIATGFNGAPRGCANCCDIGFCIRNLVGIKQGSDYNKCRSVHAEMNAMLSASRQEMLDSTIYIVGLQPSEDGKSFVYASSQPCLLCHRMMINAGIEKCIGYNQKFDKNGNPEFVLFDISTTKFDHRIYSEYVPILASMEDPIARDAFIRNLRFALGINDRVSELEFQDAIEEYKAQRGDSPHVD